MCLLRLRTVKRFSTLNTGAFYYVCLMAYTVPWNSFCFLHSRISYEDVRIALYFLFGMASTVSNGKANFTAIIARSTPDHSYVYTTFNYVCFIGKSRRRPLQGPSKFATISKLVTKNKDEVRCWSLNEK